jgi:hypothetical protein
MIQRLCVLALFVTALSLPGASQPGRGQSSQRYVSWVAGVLTRMQTIRPGMTRDALLTVFTIEGGLSTRLHRTFVSRDCPYFKVDVEFRLWDCQIGIRTGARRLSKAVATSSLRSRDRTCSLLSPTNPSRWHGRYFQSGHKTKPGNERQAIDRVWPHPHPLPSPAEAERTLAIGR